MESKQRSSDGSTSSKPTPSWPIVEALKWADTRISRTLASASSFPALRTLMMTLELSGNGVFWFAAAFLLLAATAAHTELLLNFIIGLTLDLAVVGALKVAFRRARPAYDRPDMPRLVSVDRYSFPSGHTTRAVLVAEFVVYRAAWLGARLFVWWAAAIAASRVALGRHHFSDVVAGAVIGHLQYRVLDAVWLSLAAFG